MINMEFGLFTKGHLEKFYKHENIYCISYNIDVYSIDANLQRSICISLKDKLLYFSNLDNAL